MFMYLLVLPIVMGFPSSSFAQFVDKGEYVEVAKGTKLCANVILEKSKGKIDPEKSFGASRATCGPIAHRLLQNLSSKPCTTARAGRLRLRRAVMMRTMPRFSNETLSTRGCS